jgi:glycosyltransferase involved in cell wall biosynthesis
VAREKGAVVVFEPHNQISRARNSAAAGSSGQWLVFLDGDTLLNGELLRATLAAFSSGKYCGGGALVGFDRPPEGFIARALIKLWTGVSTGFQLAAGSYVFCLREAWAEVGGFDEKVYAGEELYFSVKLKRWGKKRGLRFRILTEAPVVTSARKLEWYGPWELLWQMLLMARPWAIHRREDCGLWYSRPPEKKSQNFPPQPP